MQPEAHPIMKRRKTSDGYGRFHDLDSMADSGNFLARGQVAGQWINAVESEDGRLRITRQLADPAVFRVELQGRQDTHLMLEIGQVVRLKNGECLLVHSFAPHLPQRYGSTGIRRGTVVGVLISSTQDNQDV
jgi:hypothetical protein